ncbi:MAG: AAA family ATPase [Taibaiella sp.]|nr:AAA family ATPase [Taibaiella sp.]
MRLCYIWIEDYKGFINQGFNLSTKYVFDYDVSTSLLTKTDNNKYINNFFGRDILDVVGIIGQNASGKTNILELIQYIADDANTIINKPFVVVVEKGRRLIVYYFKMPNIKMNFESKKEIYEGAIPELDSIFFSNIFDGRRHNLSKNIINISTNDLLNAQFGENINKNYQKTVQQQIKFIKSEQFQLLEDIEKTINTNKHVRLKPSTVILTSPIWSNIIQRVKAFDNWHERNIGGKPKLKDFALSFRKKITDNQSVNSLRYFSAFLVFIDFAINRVMFNRHENTDVVWRLNEIIYPFINEISPDSRVDDMFDLLTLNFAGKIESIKELSDTYKFLTDLRHLDLGFQDSSIFREDLGTYANRRIQFTLNYDDSVGDFITGYLNATTNQSLSYSIEWAGISSGHKAYINLFANFFSITDSLRESTVWVCIDEGDLYFHPKWQTEFLFKLINILPKILNRKCQIFLTTHSPFLVSDLPKNNLLFLQKGEDGLSVMSNEKIDGETFGGNIGELYLDAFFMQGSLISHFAASKIQAIVNKINNTKTNITDDDRILISEIGDAFIRSQLKKMTDDKDR